MPPLGRRASSVVVFYETVQVSVTNVVYPGTLLSLDHLQDVARARSSVQVLHRAPKSPKFRLERIVGSEPREGRASRGGAERRASILYLAASLEDFFLLKLIQWSGKFIQKRSTTDKGQLYRKHLGSGMLLSYA